MSDTMTNPEHLAALSEAELLPCPFCGGEGETWEDADPIYPWCVTFKHEDECMMRLVPTDFFPAYKTKAEAIAAWNTRAGHLAVIGPDAVEGNIQIADVTARAEAAEAKVERLRQALRHCASDPLFGNEARAALQETDQ